MRFSCWAVRRRASPRRGGSDLVLTRALLVYMYSSMESAKQKKFARGGQQTTLRTDWDTPASLADRLRTIREQLGDGCLQVADNQGTARGRLATNNNN